MYRAVAVFTVALFCIGATECRTDDADLGTEEDVDFTTLEYDDGTPVRGSFSGVDGKRLMVIRDINDFTETWNDHVANVFPQPAQPEVDFGTDMIIAAFMGVQPTGGYSIEIEEVRENDQFLVVEVEMETPGDDCVVEQAQTQPFHMVVVPDSELPVQFTETTVEGAAC